ncbi:MAG: ParB/RepB/Spo0J family partition protein [Clostridia bacterium]
MAGKTKGLGKGLNALFGETTDEYELALAETNGGAPSELPLDLIYPNSNQPRKTFDETALEELKNSILTHGVINPIVVNKIDGKYQIIAGERRYRASLLAGLTRIPAIIMDINEKKVREIALIENLQREDLNAVEAAKGIKELMDRYGLTQEAVSERISKSRSNIANLLRVLTLPQEVIDLVQDGKLTVGHAKALAGLPNEKDIVKFALIASDMKMSVRELEKRVNELQKPKTEPVKKEISLELRDLVDKMQTTFATKVTAIGSDNKGRIVIDYFTKDDLDRILDLIEIIKFAK